MTSGYRAVAKRRGAYAAMPPHEPYRAVAKRKSAYAAMPPHNLTHAWNIRLKGVCIWQKRDLNGSGR